MNWAASHFYWIPLAVFVVTCGIFLRIAFRNRMIRRAIDSTLRTTLRAETAPAFQRVRAVLWVTAIALGCTALMRPQWGEVTRQVQRRGLDLVVLFDTSKSMLAEDVKPNRLQRGKWLVEGLVERARGDRFALIAFAGSSFLQCPLTGDAEAFRMHLNDLHTGIIPLGGTDLVQALDRAENTFPEGNSSDKVILLVSDGEQHAAGLDEQIERLKEKNIRVFSVGVGTPEGGFIPTSRSNNAGGFQKNRKGEVILTRLEGAVLKDLAARTRGAYTRSGGGYLGVEAVWNSGLAQLKRAQLDNKEEARMAERYQLFLLPAVFLLILEGTIRIPGFAVRRGRERRMA